MGWFFVRGIAMVFDRYLQADRTPAPASPASSEQGYEQHVGYCMLGPCPGHGFGGW